MKPLPPIPMPLMPMPQPPMPICIMPPPCIMEFPIIPPPPVMISFIFLVTHAEGFLTSGPSPLRISWARCSGICISKSALELSSTPCFIRLPTISCVLPLHMPPPMPPMPMPMPQPPMPQPPMPGPSMPPPRSLRCSVKPACCSSFTLRVTNAEGFLTSGPMDPMISFAQCSGAFDKKSALTSSSTPHSFSCARAVSLVCHCSGLALPPKWTMITSSFRQLPPLSYDMPVS
mmetsp:Transcript_41159/g.107162  ORF Transcript_41159/g.107162 Transcript_41159/m.107162 type:complete len:231 (-) Transcript_41159:844-1536(-)